MSKRFTRSAFYEHYPALLSKGFSKGRRANADLYYLQFSGHEWVVKDFLSCPPLLRNTWGRWVVRHEYQALTHLQGIEGIPAEPFQLDAYALGYRFILGRTLHEAIQGEFPEDFFYRLEKLVHQMHSRNIVHLDLRNRRNILIQSDENPALLDFQTSINIRHFPAPFRRFLREIDLSGVYKMWRKFRPDLLDKEREERLEAFNRKRSAWILRGYPMGILKKRKD